MSLPVIAKHRDTQPQLETVVKNCILVPTTQLQIGTVVNRQDIRTYSYDTIAAAPTTIITTLAVALGAVLELGDTLGILLELGDVLTSVLSATLEHGDALNAILGPALYTALELCDMLHSLLGATICVALSAVLDAMLGFALSAALGEVLGVTVGVVVGTAREINGGVQWGAHDSLQTLFSTCNECETSAWVDGGVRYGRRLHSAAPTWTSRWANCGCCKDSSVGRKEPVLLRDYCLAEDSSHKLLDASDACAISEWIDEGVRDATQQLHCVSPTLPFAGRRESGP
jgi:hypothetical protein